MSEQKSLSSVFKRGVSLVGNKIAPVVDNIVDVANDFLDEVEGVETPKTTRTEPTIGKGKTKVHFPKAKKERVYSMNLSKAQVVTTGERLNLSKAFGDKFTAPVVGLEWNPKAGITVDCDLSIVLLDENDKIIPGTQGANQPNCLAFYGNQDLPGVHLYADNLTGDDDESDCPTGCDEQADIDFTKLDPRVKQVVIVATTHSEAPNSTPQAPVKGAAIPFGRAAKPRVVIFEHLGGNNYDPKITYELDEENSTATAVEVAKFYQRNGQWVYTSMGDEKGTDAFGLQAMLDTYGITG